MFTQLRRFFRQFFRQSRTIKNEPINKVSLIVIILIDIFILINVFAGLDDISRWYINPSQSYPCYAEWESYRTQTTQDKDYEIVQSSLTNKTNTKLSFQQLYQQAEQEHLGKVAPICLNYGSYKDKVNNPGNQQIVKTIAQKQEKLNRLEQANRTIRAQYDSTLLEKIAGQPRERSINRVGAEKAKQELDQNNRNISTLKKDISALKNQLVSKSESVGFISFIKEDGNYKAVEKAYQNASFWYPSIQLTFQSLFLLPLILIALSIHNVAQRKGYGLIALISWHLSVVFFVPLILKVFEFLQFGVLVEFLFDIIRALFGGLLFLLSYVYIVMIPLIGFGIIKFFQRIVFNPKVQAANRVQKSRCIQCGKKVRLHDSYCPHCSCYQYVECQSCHDLTYKYLPYCKHCGHSQEPISNQ
ncbi:MAG TPA: hypothetical protein V6C95_10430 [Coleofasciculaceae cyanobacterium]